MNFSTNSNIYTFNADEVMQAFAPFVEGGSDSLTVVAYTDSASDEARNAIEKSLSRLGIGSGECTWIRLRSEAGELTAQDLMAMIEGIDPICVIGLDGETAHKLSEAYRVDLPLDKHVRIFGRNAVLFADLQKMLENEDGRQRAWAAIKTLP